MKTKKIICTIGYGIILAVTVMMFFVNLNADMQSAVYDDIFGTKFTLLYELLVFLPIVIAELDLFFSVWHLLFCKHQDSRRKTILHLVSCCWSGLAMVAVLLSIVLVICRISVNFTFVFTSLLWYVVLCVLLRIIYGIVAVVEHRKYEDH